MLFHTLVEGIKRFIGKIIFDVRRANNSFVRAYTKGKFSKLGDHTYIGHNCIFHYANIEIGSDVYIGSNAVFQSSYGKIIIGNHVMFGPGVHIHGGNHKMHEVGNLLKHTSKKQMGDDGIITIEDDVWVGANAMILNGVTIGRGSVVGAGSVVTKNVPPYSIVVGNPAKKIKDRFREDELQEHIRILQNKAK